MSRSFVKIEKGGGKGISETETEAPHLSWNYHRYPVNGICGYISDWSLRFTAYVHQVRGFTLRV